MSELEMAAKLTANRNDNGYDVPVIDLAEFILHHVHGRRLPVDDGLAAGKPAVVAKIDIEGEEKKVIPRLLATRAACAIDEMLVEWHGLSQIKQKQLKERCEKSSANVAKFKVLAKDLESQGEVNKEALEKAGAIIRKLNEDLTAALDAASTIQGNNQELKEAHDKLSEDL